MARTGGRREQTKGRNTGSKVSTWFRFVLWVRAHVGSRIPVAAITLAVESGVETIAIVESAARLRRLHPLQYATRQGHGGPAGVVVRRAASPVRSRSYNPQMGRQEQRRTFEALRSII